MKIIQKKAFPFSCMIILGLLFFYRLYLSYRELLIKDIIILFTIGILSLVFFLWTIRLDIREYKTTRLKNNFISTLIGFIMILINIGYYQYQNIKFKSPTLIKASNDGILGIYSLDLKVNGEFIITNSDFLNASYTHFYGTYSIIDSIITLDKSNIDNVIKTKKLVIKSMKISSEKGISKNKDDLINLEFISLIDNKGNEINTDLFLKVKDYRKK